MTLDGGGIECDRVVVATGPWSEAASDWLGVPIRMQPWKGQILRLRLPGPPIRASVGGGDHFASTKPDGLTWVGPTFEDAGIDETTTDWARDEIMAAVVKNVPALSEGEVVMQTACVRPLSADRKLVLGQVPGLDGAYVATGGGRLGLMLGPAMARLTADLIAKRCHECCHLTNSTPAASPEVSACEWRSRQSANAHGRSVRIQRISSTLVCLLAAPFSGRSRSPL